MTGNKPLVIYRDEDRRPPYEKALLEAGIDAEYSTPRADLQMDRFTGLVLTGGTDVNPSLYGETPLPETDAPDVERDTCELRLVEHAMQLDLPVLAICRGMQMLNVCFGGTLHQHLADTDRHRRRPADRAEPAHSVNIEPDSLLASACERLNLDVNSRHHQAVAKVGTGLRVTARSPDGIAEAIEHPHKLFLLAVQWHPEDQVFRYPEQLKLFTSFRASLNRPLRAHHK